MATKYGKTLSLSIAVACLALLAPGLAQAASSKASGATGDRAMNTMATSAEQRTAAEMVSGQAHLRTTLDAKKLQAGKQFEAVLDDDIQLKNGPELPHGTELVGEVTTDRTQPNGSSQLGLRFTEAKLKDGQVVPIRAMIAGVANPVYVSNQTTYSNAPISWNKNILQMDQIGALNNSVDFHSKIDSSNSGVFVATKKDDVKLESGSQFSLAIEARKSAGTHNGA